VFDPVRPFVLLDDVPAGRARLFTDLVEAVAAPTLADVRPLLARLCAPGPWAGWLAYEAGLTLEPKLAGLPAGEGPFGWFGRFARGRQLGAAEVAALLGEAPAQIGPVSPAVDVAWHAAAMARVQALIAAGDIYQANLTFPATVGVQGHPLALYARLRQAARAPYSALVFTGERWLLSFSPELFFRLDGRRLTARPMKGTAARGGALAEDAARAEALEADPKNRAENLMIVDLIRNDLSRVAEAGSVATPSLFDIETYPTVLQMTSTVTATAREGVAAADVLAALFPCGSVTGAPKIRSMEVIGEVETGPRGAYTGAIGAIGADGDAVFSVAIRTLATDGRGRATLGLGSGIVADSEAGDEWRECLAKAAFLARRPPPDLIETMRVEEGAVSELERHLARMAASAAWLGARFDGAAARAMVAGAVAGMTDARLRLLLAPSGALAVQLSPLPAAPPSPVPVALVPLPVDPGDWRLRHKTTDRAFYDDPRRAAGAFECLFVRPDGRLTEGSFTNLFVPRDGMLLTPPAALGLLPGVLRQRLIEDGHAVEAPLTAADLTDGFFIGNALRGLIPARLA
jgi:para-aminobenzoate synthetase/4-amino-4-deoxychorismate lyase